MTIHSLKQGDAIDDSEVIDKILEGETALYEVLIRRNNPFLYKTGRSYGFNHQDTEDLMQEAFIAAYVNLKKFQRRSSFKTWLMRIFLNLCYRKTKKSGFRYEKPSNAIFTDKTAPMFTSDQHNDVHQVVLNRELTKIVESSLNHIPLEYRMVFSLRELSGMSTSETAQALAITETNVKVRLNRAKHMLRKTIEKQYTPADIFEFNLIYCDKITHRVMQSIAECPR